MRARRSLPPGYFLRATALTEPAPAIAAFAAAGARGATTLDRLVALAAEVKARVAYRPGVTNAQTTAAAALALGSGVCQDHANVFIAACRSLGVPARYIGGYFWTGDPARSNESSHAWAEAHIEGLGWVGFDPAHGAHPGEAHIRVGVGLDYVAAAPVRGLRRGDAEETLAVSAAESAQ
jgi:transglutaminase-like putative cysteine protease